MVNGVRGTILSHLGDAEYSVSVRHGDPDKFDDLIQKIDNKRDELQDWLDEEVDPKVTEYEGDLSTALSELDTAISTYNGDPTPENWDAVLDKVKQANTARANLRPWKYEQDLATLQRALLFKRKLYLANLKLSAEQTESLWCYDLRDDDNDPPATGHYTKIANGTVIRVNYPGRTYDNEGIIADPNPVEDSDETPGDYFPPGGVTSPELFVAMAFVPGAARFNPLLRYATITDIDYGEHTCSLEYDPLDKPSDVWLGSAGSLDTHQDYPTDDVGIVYMDCNSWAFEVGDHVVVDFDQTVGQPWTVPTVIGFVDNPKKCKYPGGFQFYDGDNDEYIFVQWDDLNDEYVASTGSTPKVGSSHWVKDFSGTVHHVSVVYPGLDTGNSCYPQFITARPSGGQVVHNQTVLPLLPISTNGTPNYRYRASAAGRASNGDIEAIAHYSYKGAIGADDRSGMAWCTYNGSSWSIDWQHAQENAHDHFCLGTSSAMDASLNFKGTNIKKFVSTVSTPHKLEADSTGYTLTAITQSTDTTTATKYCAVGLGDYESFHTCVETNTPYPSTKVTSGGVVTIESPNVGIGNSTYTGECYVDVGVETRWTGQLDGSRDDGARRTGTIQFDTALEGTCSADEGTTTTTSADYLVDMAWCPKIKFASTYLNTYIGGGSGGSNNANHSVVAGGTGAFIIEYSTSVAVPCSTASFSFECPTPGADPYPSGFFSQFTIAQPFVSDAVGNCFLDINATRWTPDGYKFHGPFPVTLLSNDIANADIVVVNTIPKVS